MIHEHDERRMTGIRRIAKLYRASNLSFNHNGHDGGTVEMEFEDMIDATAFVSTSCLLRTASFYSEAEHGDLMDFNTPVVVHFMLREWPPEFTPGDGLD